MEKLVELLKDHDIDTYHHSYRVAELSLHIARSMDLSEWDQKITYYSGLLHDIGKSRVGKEILVKPGKLTLDEWVSIQQHPIFGFKILKGYPLPDDEIKYVVLFHHERLNGSGYPFNLRDEHIPLKAKIVAVADSFDAMTNNRSYSRAKSFNEALNQILSDKGTLFDPIAVDALYRHLNGKV